MPHKNKMNPPKEAPKKRRRHSEDVVKQAIEDIKTFGMSVRGAAKKHNIPEATLRHKVSGYHGMASKPGPKTLLTDAEEQVLVNYVTNGVKRAQPVTKKNLLDAVKDILQDEERMGIARKQPPSFSGEPKRKWWSLFLQRHPTLTFRTPESLTSARKNISVAVIKQWFHSTHDYLKEVDASDVLEDPARVFNIDETGFCLSPSVGKVLAPRGEKNVFEERSLHLKTNITVLGCVCANGSIPPPMIIYPRKRINPTMAEKFPSDYNFTVGKSEKGYITYETLYEYLCNDFNDWLTEQHVQRPVIVYTDWHETRSNYFLAKTLNELNIILYGLPPNTTHFMQPLDVSVFGPLKKGWARSAREWENANNESVTQVTFAQAFMPAYHKYLSAENIKSGFAKCGLLPFNSDSPDFSKLEAAAAQKEHASTIFEGIDQGGYREASTQTTAFLAIHRGTQTLSDPTIEIGLSKKKIMMMCGHTGSLCDLIIDCKQYAPLQEFYKNAYRHFTSQETEKEFQQTPKSIPQISPQPSVSCRSEDGAKKNTSKISPSMLKHNFYPERRPGRGPKIVKTDLDRTFALSSKKTARCLKQRMEKKKTGGGKLQIPTKGQPKAKKCKVQRCVEFPSSATPAPLPQAPKKIPPTPPDEPLQASSASPGLLPPTSPEILPPASPELGVAGTSHCRSPSPVSSTSSITDHVSLHDTSDDSMGLDDGEINQCIKLPIQKPVLDSWVGVKVSKALTTARGRKTIPFEVYVARVTDYEGNGFAVSFLKEKANGFYVNPETEEIASVLEEELVVLEPPTAVNKQRTFGFQFPDNISSILRDYFFSQGKAINY